MSQIAVKYVGVKTLKSDNVANTGLTWVPGEIHLVSGPAAQRLLQHPDVWANANAEVAADPGLLSAGLAPSLLQQVATPAEASIRAGGEPESDQAQQPVVQPFNMPNLHGMTKGDIVSFAKSQFGTELDESLKKDDLIASVTTLANSRAGGEPQ